MQRSSTGRTPDLQSGWRGFESLPLHQIKKMMKRHKDYVSYSNDDGYLHRLDGPAMLYNDGSYEWYKNGIFHRIDGPAVYYINGPVIDWWINGNKITKVVNKWMTENNISYPFTNESRTLYLLQFVPRYI